MAQRPCEPNSPVVNHYTNILNSRNGYCANRAALAMNGYEPYVVIWVSDGMNQTFSAMWQQEY